MCFECVCTHPINTLFNWIWFALWYVFEHTLPGQPFSVTFLIFDFPSRLVYFFFAPIFIFLSVFVSRHSVRKRFTFTTVVLLFFWHFCCDSHLLFKKNQCQLHSRCLSLYCLNKTLTRVVCVCIKIWCLSDSATVTQKMEAHAKQSQTLGDHLAWKSVLNKVALFIQIRLIVIFLLCKLSNGGSKMVYSWHFCSHQIYDKRWDWIKFKFH
jgi:hypothetical protein